MVSPAMPEQLLAASAVVAACALLTAGLIAVLTPTFARHFMTRPADRRIDEEAVPQGAGLALTAAMVAVYVGLWSIGHLEGTLPWPVPVLGAAVGLTMLGAVEDAISVPLSWRLAGQLAAAFAVVLSLPDGFQILPGVVPLALERLAMVAAAVAFINAVTFLDGVDWITVAQAVPMTLAIAALQFLGYLPVNVGLLALVLLGGMLGFALFNRYPARIFLGDAGSLPIGLCLAWLLFFVAKEDIVAAVLLPLYTISDAGLTLGRRLIAGEAIFSPHRTHFYQRAITLGFKAPDVTARIFLLGTLLGLLAIAAVMTQSPLLDAGLLLIGAAATGGTLFILARGKL